MVRIAVTVLLLAMSTSSFGQMYKWVDKEGKVHYSDKPPPAGAKQQPTRDNQPSPTAKGKSGAAQTAPREAKQGSFRPEEEVALHNVCVIYLLETLTCRLNLKRYCPLEELVAGIGGNPKKVLRRDPRSDPNYEYRVDIRPDNFTVVAIPRKPGLTGFFENRNSGTRFNPNGAAGADDQRVQGGISCPNVE
jgi:hypothetical protein